MAVAIPQPTKYGDAATPWRFMLATPLGVDLGEITDLRDRSLVFGLNRATTFSATMDIVHPHMATLMNEPDYHLLIKCYRRGKLMSVQEVATGELKGDDAGSHAIRLTGTETAYRRIAGRHVGKSQQGLTLTGDRAGLAAIILAQVNAEKDSKVRMGAVSTSSTVTVGPWRYKPALSGIAELGATLNGYDHWITPADPAVDPNACYGYLNAVALRGAVKDNCALHYGTGNLNAREYSLTWDTSKRITRAIVLPADFPDNPALRVVTRTVDGATAGAGTTAIETTLGIGMREEVIENDLVDETLRTVLADEHIAVRKKPRQLFTMQPRVSLGDGVVPEFGFDYDIGDIIEGRVIDSGLAMLNAMVRVYQATVELDRAGVEKITLGMVDEETTGS